MEKFHNRQDLGIWLTWCQPEILLRQRWCPHLLNLFTKLSHYLFCVRISLGRGGVGQMGFKTFPSGVEQAQMGSRRYRKASNTWEGKGEGKKKQTLPALHAGRGANMRCGKLAEPLPTHPLTAETRTALQEMLDCDSTAANTCLVFNIITTHRCAGGEFVQQSASMFF